MLELTLLSLVSVIVDVAAFSVVVDVDDVFLIVIVIVAEVEVVV